MDGYKKELSELQQAIQWVAAQYKYLKELRDDIAVVEKDNRISEEAKALRKARKALRFVNRSSWKADRHIHVLLQRLRMHPEFSTLEGRLDIEEKQLIKAFSLYRGSFRDSLRSLTKAVAKKKVLQLFKHSEAISTEERKVKSLALALEKHLDILIPWAQGLEADLTEGRRDVFRLAARTAGITALDTVSRAAPAATFVGSFFSWLHNAKAQGHLRIQYVTYKKEICLKIPVRKGMGYWHVASYVTENVENVPMIAEFNDQKRLKVGDAVYVPRKYVSRLLKKILDENKFERFTIDSEEASSLAEIMEVNCDLRNGYDETLSALLVINDDINLAFPVMHDNDPIIIPKSLISKELIREEREASANPIREAEVPQAPKKEVKRPTTSEDKLLARMTTYQNPYRLPESIVWGRVIPKGKFGVSRVRNGKLSGRHNGLDLPAEHGTRLYPIGVGQVTMIKDYAGTGYWRNGKTIEIQLATGYLVKYCHMQKFRSGLRVGHLVDLDTVIGYVNTSGNCPKHEPHVHIGVTTAALKPQKKYLNPTLFIRQSTPEGRRLLAEFQASVRSNRTAYLKLFREIEQKAL